MVLTYWVTFCQTRSHSKYWTKAESRVSKWKETGWINEVCDRNSAIY